MSAISTVMLAFLKPGDLLLISNPTYGGTHTFVNNYLKEIGVHVISFDFDHNYDDILNKSLEAFCIRQSMTNEIPSDADNDIATISAS